MNDQTGNTQSNQRPQLFGYAVRPIGDGKKSSWSKIGVAWAHKDGKGFDIRMDAFPVDGRLVLREPTEDKTADAPAASPDGLS